MQTQTSQNTVLGKRAHQTDGGSNQVSSTMEALASSQCPLTPEITPKSKRARTSDVSVDGNSNKENIPPFRWDNFGDVSPATPSSSRMLRRTNTITVSPQRTRHASALSTPPPTPHDILLPVYARARALLRATCNGTTPIAGREAERDVIIKFITSATSESSDTFKRTLFISGSPGTGKTALVNSILADFGADCSDLEVVSINCMGFQTVDTLWQRVCESLMCFEHVPRNGTLKGRRLLEEVLASRQRRCLLVLDELDHIASSSTALSLIFSLTRKHQSILHIIGIANTHTLTSSFLSSNDAMDVHTLHFGAYTSTQLMEVLQARLAPLFVNDGCSGPEARVQKLLPPSTLTLLCKKVASQTGDVRTLFEVLRGAIDLAVSGGRKDENPLASTPVITPNHILSALKAYMPANGVVRCHTSALPNSSSVNSEVVTKVRNLGLQARLVLLSAVLAAKRVDAALPLLSSSSPNKTLGKRTGSVSSSSKAAGLELAQLHGYYATILASAGSKAFAPLSRSEFSDVIGVLETSGLVSSSTSLEAVTSPTKSGRRGFGRSSSFGGNSKCIAAGRDIKVMDGIRVDEVLRGLGISDASTQNPDLLEEEITTIWTRESGRIAKGIKAASRPAGERGRLPDENS